VKNEPQAPSRAFLETQLALQKLQMKRLLQLTQAVHEATPDAQLYEMFSSTLTQELETQEFALFVKGEQGWRCCAAEASWKLLGEELSADFFDAYPRATRITGEEEGFVSHFDYILPVGRNKQMLAYVLVKDIRLSDPEQLLERLNLISTLTNVVIVGIKNRQLSHQQLERERLRRELELAAQVQSMLIPSELPKNEVYEFAGIYQPHEGIGGDYYDFNSLGTDEIAFCIADISGKGVAAALLMSNFQASLQSLIHDRNMHVRKFVQQLNTAVLRTTKGEKFITFFLARYHLGKRRLRYLCAGHNPPILVMDGKLQRLDKGCTILGVFKNIPKLEMGEVYLDKEAFCLLYTDGLTDLRNESGEFFGDTSLEQFVLEHHGKSTEEFNTLLMQTVNKFRGKEPFPDDISVLAGKIF
jgi:sigma-B regulation protein RsbU (phosphoserine phosphatase)